MSRTDRHAPYWVVADWYEPCHMPGCPNSQNRLGGWYPTHECDLPDEPVRQRGISWRERRVKPRCIWTPVFPAWRQCRWLTLGPSVPQWYVDHVWYNAERVRQRDGLRNLAREYNSYGELADGDFPNWQHRHGATWYWD